MLFENRNAGGAEDFVFKFIALEQFAGDCARLGWFALLEHDGIMEARVKAATGGFYV